MRAQFGPSQLAYLLQLQQHAQGTDLVKELAKYGLVYINPAEEKPVLPSISDNDLMLIANIYLYSQSGQLGRLTITHPLFQSLPNNYDFSFLFSANIIKLDQDHIILNPNLSKPVAIRTTTAIILAEPKRKIDQSTQTEGGQPTQEDLQAAQTQISLLQNQNAALRAEIKEGQEKINYAHGCVSHFSKRLKVAENHNAKNEIQKEAIATSAIGLSQLCNSLLSQKSSLMGSFPNFFNSSTKSELVKEMLLSKLNTELLIKAVSITKEQSQTQASANQDNRPNPY